MKPTTMDVLNWIKSEKQKAYAGIENAKDDQEAMVKAATAYEALNDMELALKKLINVWG